MRILGKGLLRLRIARTEDPAELRTIREREQKRLSEALSPSTWSAVNDSLRDLHDALTGQAVRLAEKETARLGLGAPPVPYAYLLFGSGGRMEQTSFSDQDSGIVFADPESPEDAEACRTYFLKLGDSAVRILTEMGYPPCDGGVVASNPVWCHSLTAWQKRIGAWFDDPSWENVRHLLILADARPVAGSLELAESLAESFHSYRLRSPVIVRRMAENTMRHKVLVGVFGQLLRERYGEHAGGIDIKYGAYIPMVNAFRLLAVRAGIRATCTLGRISALGETGCLTLQEAEEAARAFSLILRMREWTGGKYEGGVWRGSGMLPKEVLTKERERQLRTALRFAKNIQRKVEREGTDRFGGR